MENWRNSPAFLGMDEIKRQKVEELFNLLNGKNINDALPVVTSWNMQLKQENISFTSQENELLSQLFLAELSPAQMKQFEFLKSFMKK